MEEFKKNGVFGLLLPRGGVLLSVVALSRVQGDWGIGLSRGNVRKMQTSL